MLINSDKQLCSTKYKIYGVATLQLDLNPQSTQEETVGGNEIKRRAHSIFYRTFGLCELHMYVAHIRKHT